MDQLLRAGASVEPAAKNHEKPSALAFEPSATLVARVGYRGANFSGFAYQESQRTVAGELTRALETFLRRPVELTCAGRTDAGVHAIGQVISVPVSADEAASLEGRRLFRALNALTPQDISVGALYKAPVGFSARFDAVSRRYRYRIVTGAKPIMLADVSWWQRAPLEVAPMAAAAHALVGEHDFKTFCKQASAEGKRTMRCIKSLDVYATTELGEHVIAVDICGNAFLHNMVRIIAGTLAEVGRGLRAPESMVDVLAARDRRAAGPTAPPQGLTFVGVEYQPDLLQPWQ